MSYTSIHGFKHTSKKGKVMNYIKSRDFLSALRKSIYLEDDKCLQFEFEQVTTNALAISFYWWVGDTEVQMSVTANAFVSEVYDNGFYTYEITDVNSVLIPKNIKGSISIDDVANVMEEFFEIHAEESCGNETDFVVNLGYKLK